MISKFFLILLPAVIASIILLYNDLLEEKNVITVTKVISGKDIRKETLKIFRALHSSLLTGNVEKILPYLTWEFTSKHKLDNLKPKKIFYANSRIIRTKSGILVQIIATDIYGSKFSDYLIFEKTHDGVLLLKDIGDKNA